MSSCFTVLSWAASASWDSEGSWESVLGGWASLDGGGGGASAGVTLSGAETSVPVMSAGSASARQTISTRNALERDGIEHDAPMSSEADFASFFLWLFQRSARVLLLSVSGCTCVLAQYSLTECLTECMAGC